MSIFSQRWIAAYLCIWLSFGATARSVAAAEVTDGLLLPKDVLSKSHGSEFVSGNSSQPVLMQINLWGGVNKPGIHYVPIRTDLMTLLSFAGGPTEAAKLSEVVIKRKIASDGADQQLLRVNVEDALSGKSGLNPVLQANDIVMIPVSKPLISQNTLSVIAVTGGILSIVIAGFIIQNQLKK